MIILGIETSCDETGVAIYDGKENKILAENLYSQVHKHLQYGGVVPELASRDHITKLLPLVSMTIKQSRLEIKDIDGIAFTAGPGLRGPLLVGSTLAQSLALGWEKPCIGINHMEAHLLINLLENPPPDFPFITLLISGGHCLLIEAKGIGKYKVLGQTKDDAVGEAFDKVAKLLGLNYPGGPEIEKIAKLGNPHSYKLPRPMAKGENLDFSFSGLKTAVFYITREQGEPVKRRFKADLAASFQLAVSDILVWKCRKALLKNGLNQLVVGGGVASNAFIRKKLDEDLDGIDLYFPKLSRCTDNGAMVAVAGYYRFKDPRYKNSLFKVKSRWELDKV